jgi:thiol-disulfide isomerase/thioredoxin
MSNMLDPWRDASAIAALLSSDASLLVVMVGAEQWCARCRALRPVFDELAAQRGANEVWLWLDMEDHADFIGDDLPENLPVLMAYRGDRLVLSHVLATEAASIRTRIDAARSAPPPAGLSDPGIRARLLVADWAQ